ncbi:MAG: lipocalin-like domain-containing protein [Candidatus Sulfotelmatobacter sp.]
MPPPMLAATFERVTVHSMIGNSDERLVGTWKLVSASSATASGGQSEPPYGINPVGFLTYSEDGRVTALISYGGRKPLSIGVKPPALVEEQAEAFKTFLAYAGRYSLSGDKIIHSIEISSIQNYVNKELVRSVKFQGDQIVLVTPPTMVNGKIQTMELVWERLGVGS